MAETPRPLAGGRAPARCAVRAPSASQPAPPGRSASESDSERSERRAPAVLVDGFAELCDRTRRALQDYCALNTIITAIEQVRASKADPLARALVEAFTADDYEYEWVRLRLDCPLGRRAAALGMLSSRRRA